MKDRCDCEMIHPDILAKVEAKMLDDREFSNVSLLFKLFSDSTRVKILYALSVSEMCVCDVAVLLNMTKSAISHQLKQLRLSNLVKAEKRGKNVFYSLADEHVKLILEIGFAHSRE